MTFAAPIYLLLLVPWIGALIWVLLGRVDFARVSTTQFWDKTDTTSRTRRGIRNPPLSMWLLLASAFLVILSAAGLSVTRKTPTRILLIVDRSVASLPWAIADASARSTFADQTVDLRTIPASNQATVEGSNLTDTLKSFRPTATRVDADQITASVESALIEGHQQIIVITTQPLEITDNRVWIIYPSQQIDNAGIAAFAVVQRPKAQAMVRVWNDTPLDKAELSVDQVTQTIELPPRGQTRDYFIDLPYVTAWTIARLTIDDAIDADNVAYVVQEGGRPRVEAISPIPDSVARIIAIHNKDADASLPPITLGDRPRVGQPAIILTQGKDKLAGALQVQDHPVTRGIDWTAVASRLVEKTSVTGSPLDAGDLAWITSEGQVLLAGRSEQVWIGFDLRAIESTPDFVLLLSNAIDWLGKRGQRVIQSELPRILEPGWVRVADDPLPIDAAPGVYERDEEGGAFYVAMTLPAIRPSKSAESSAPAWQPSQVNRTVSLSAWALIGAIGLLGWALLRLT